MARLPWLAALALFFVVAPAGIFVAAPAEAETSLIGAAWEAELLRGIREQDLERRRVQPDALVAQNERLAARPTSNQVEKIRRLYLLARAYGIRHADLAKRASEAQNPAERQELEKRAARDLLAAKQTYEEVLREAPRCYFALHDRAILDLQGASPDRRRAAEALRAAVNINPTYGDAWRKLALLYTQVKDWRSVVVALERLVKLEPKDVMARASLANAYAQLRDFPKAYAQVDALQAEDAENPAWRDVRAQLDFAAGNIDQALKTYRELAEELPTVPNPLQGYLRCLDWKLKNEQPVTPEDFLWPLERLYRIERDPDMRSKLAEQIQATRDAIRDAKTRPKEGEPPTEEQLLAILNGPNEEGRYQVLLMLELLPKPPPPAFLRSAIGRVSSRAEPSARVRAMAVRVLGRHGGFSLIPIVRLLLAQDPSQEVRLAAADALVAMADLGPAPAGGVVLILGGYAQDRDPQVAAAARLGVLQIAKGQLPDEAADNDAAHRRAFARWWSATTGQDVQMRGLDTYHELMDKTPEDVLLAYLDSPSFFVFKSAYDAFSRVAAQLKDPVKAKWYQSRPGYAAWRTWLEGLPRFEASRKTPANRAALQAEIDAWRASKP